MILKKKMNRYYNVRIKLEMSKTQRKKEQTHRGKYRFAQIVKVGNNKQSAVEKNYAEDETILKSTSSSQVFKAPIRVTAFS